MAAPQETGTPAPAAKPISTERPKPGGKGSIGDRMEAAGWKPEDVDEGSHGEPRPEAEPEKAPAKKPAAKTAKKPVEEGAPEPDAAAKAATKDAEALGAIGLLKKLAAEQGFSVEDGKVTTKERAEFRIFKQEQRNQLAQQERAALEKIEAAQKALEDRHKRVESLEGALKSRDHNAVAKALGFDDFEKFQQEIVAWNSDPHYAEIRELKEFKRRQEEEAETAAKQRQAHEQEQARVQAESTYLSNLSEAMKASQDPLVSAMAEDPLFRGAVYRIQQENWDGRETVTPEQAVRMAARGGRVTLVEELKALHERLGKAFGPKTPAAAEKPPAPKPKITSTPKPGPSEPAKFARRADRINHYSQRLAEAGDRDSKSGSAY